MDKAYRQPRNYELMTVLIPDLDEEATNAQVERVKAIVSASGEIADTLQSSPWGRRRLAYTIRHNSQDYRDGYYLLTYFTALPDTTAEIERELKLDDQVMRFLLLQSEPYVAPVPETAESEEAEAERAAGSATEEAAPAVNAATQPAPTAAPFEGTEAAPEQVSTEPRPIEPEVIGQTADESAAERVAEVADEPAEDTVTSTAPEEIVATRED